jgi:hypothetical protein
LTRGATFSKASALVYLLHTANKEPTFENLMTVDAGATLLPKGALPGASLFSRRSEAYYEPKEIY